MSKKHRDEVINFQQTYYCLNEEIPPSRIPLIYNIKIVHRRISSGRVRDGSDEARIISLVKWRPWHKFSVLLTGNQM